MLLFVVCSHTHTHTPLFVVDVDVAVLRLSLVSGDDFVLWNYTSIYVSLRYSLLLHAMNDYSGTRLEL